MTRHLTVFALMFVFCLSVATGCKSRTTVSDPLPVAIQGLDKSKVEKAIGDALPKRGWEFVEKKGMVITARNIIRGRHTVVVDIDYSGDEVLIKYADSENLEYEEEGGVQYIHKNYNTWVSYLRQDIASAISPLRI